MAILDRVPVDRINARAATIRLLPLLLSLLALPLFVLGFVTFRVVKGAGTAIKWTAAAFLVGFEAARERAG